MLYVATYNAGQDSRDGPPPEEPDRVIMVDPDQYTDEVWTSDPVVEQSGNISGLGIGPDGNLYLIDAASANDDDWQSPACRY